MSPGAVGAKLLVAWGVALTLRWLAPSTPAEATLREEIVADVVDVAVDPWEEPLFRGPLGRERTIAQVLAIMRYEGEFRVDVDEGIKRGKAGDVCQMQVVIPRGKAMRLSTDLFAWVPARDARPGDLTPEDLVPGSIPGRRESCIRAGLHMMRESFRACRSLALYTRGSCLPEARAKMYEALARESFRRYPPPRNIE